MSQYWRRAPAALAVGTFVASAAAQIFLINDRTNDVQWRLEDADGNGVIDEPGEYARWFDASNAAGTLAPQNPTCLAVRSDGYVIFGDQLNRVVYALQDGNDDDDALDAGESIVGASAGNASGVSFAFPTGAAFDRFGDAYIVNAGNSFGDDGVYRLVDLNGDRDFQDAGEITAFLSVGAFGVGNGPFSPQELVFDAENVAFLRNSSGGLHGVYRADDLNGNGIGDDPGEFTAFFDASNVDGVPAAAGFALALDPVRPRALYTLQILSGGVDQLLRLQDLNNDGDALDGGEAVAAFTRATPGFTALDILALPDGRVVLTDTGLDQLLLLTDRNADQMFTDDEAELYFANALFELAGLRQVGTLPLRAPGDLNCDGAVTVSDIGPFVTALTQPRAYFANFGACNRQNADLNLDGAVTVGDIGLFVSALLGP